MGSTASTSHKGKTEEVPLWIYTAQLSGDQSEDKFGGVSPGFQLLGPNTVARQRKGNFDTDGARWKKGFESGKHIFEIVYPVAQRGTDASVGIGYADAPLHVKGKCSLVGNNKMSWGIDLRTRRAVHNNGITAKYPQTQVFLPDKFYMYLDADSGAIQFGSDHDYYGTAHTGIPMGQPVYPMVSAVAHGATVTMVYRGEGHPNRIVNITVVPAGPPLQKPKPREDPPPYTESVPSTNQVPFGREITTMSKQESGPPPPPPTKMSNQPANDNVGSQMSLKDDKKEVEKTVEVIPEETKEIETNKGEKTTEPAKETEPPKEAEKELTQGAEPVA